MSPNPMGGMPPGMSHEELMRLLSIGAASPGESKLASAMGAGMEAMEGEGMPGGMPPGMSGAPGMPGTEGMPGREMLPEDGMDPETLALIQQLLRSQNSPLGQSMQGESCGPQMMTR